MNLVLSPHPDDAEYSISGKILSDWFVNWTVVTISCGGDNDSTTGLARCEESDRFWSQFPNVKHIALQVYSIDNMPEWELVAKIDELIPDYDTIYVPPLDDNHFEHRKVSKAARASARGKKISLIEYYTPSTRSTWVPNMFADIEDYYQRKTELLKTFESQSDRFYFSDKNVEIFHEDYFCRLRGLDKVEKFRVEYMFE
tara:strand:+ start:11644 stop:12240 length:597 start_codon:yes stop_codon:yes gene_type:complete